MRLAFMGTPDFAARSLAELVADGREIACVYTRAPKPSGRGKKLHKSPVHQLAEKFGIDVRTPKSLRREEEQDAFKALDLDAAIVVAYGLILPLPILGAPRLGCFNLHGSLLPRWRGAAPIQRAIMAGDTETGVQVMRMEEGLDTGPVLLSETATITKADTAGSLHDRLADIGAQLLPRFLAALERGGLQEVPQPAEGVTYAEKISSAEARINWSAPALEIDCMIRGLSPFPGAFSFLAADGKDPERLKLLFSEALAEPTGKAPGTVVSVDNGLVVACGQGAVRLSQLQRPGKKSQPAEEFLKGFTVSPGAVFKSKD
ncbi:MAG: methionyl-tRNA formyltransferase [Pseudomonadota bacterium]